jgi:Lon protease-like protein
MVLVRPDRIPLFPLNVVLLPGAELPLHIFEPRYRRMVNKCLSQRSEFGMLLSMSSGVARVGCTAEIMEVLTRYPDGRMDILSVGRMPFRAVELFTDNPLLEGQVDYLEDREVSNESPKPELVELYETCHTLIFGDYPKNLARDSAPSFSFQVAAALPMDLMWKQQLLELRTETERQERLIGHLRCWAPHLQKVASVRSQSAGNAHGLN